MQFLMKIQKVNISKSSIDLGLFFVLVHKNIVFFLMKFIKKILASSVGKILFLTPYAMVFYALDILSAEPEAKLISRA